MEGMPSTSGSGPLPEPQQHTAFSSPTKQPGMYGDTPLRWARGCFAGPLHVLASC